MTLIESTYLCDSLPRESSFQALDDVSDVYGIRRISFDDSTRSIRVEYDKSRLTEYDVAALLRDAGIDLRNPVPGAIYERGRHWRR